MYTERDELLDDVAEMWREKEVEKDQEKGGKADAKALEVERRNAAVGMRAAASEAAGYACPNCSTARAKAAGAGPETGRAGAGQEQNGQ